MLKEKSLDLHIAPDVDDLLDALWYHGSAVDYIMMETAASSGLDAVFTALEDWPDLKVLVFCPADDLLGPSTDKRRFERNYSLQTVSHWLDGRLSGSLDGGPPSI